MPNIKVTKAMIEPFKLQDEVTGVKIKLIVSPLYSVLSINDRSYYFYRENGKLDGTSTDLTFYEPKPKMRIRPVYLKLI